MLITTVRSHSCPDAIRPTAPTRWPERILVKILNFLWRRRAPRTFIHSSCHNGLIWVHPCGTNCNVKTGKRYIFTSTEIILDRGSRWRATAALHHPLRPLSVTDSLYQYYAFPKGLFDIHDNSRVSCNRHCHYNGGFGFVSF